jgi:hypothetical protein
MADNKQKTVLAAATRLLTNISFAIDAAFEVSESYPEADRTYVQEVLRGLRKDLVDALPVKA